MDGDGHTESIGVLAITILKMRFPLFFYTSNIDKAVRVRRVFNEHEGREIVQLLDEFALGGHQKQLGRRSARVKVEEIAGWPMAGRAGWRGTHIPVTWNLYHSRLFPSLERFHPLFCLLAIINRFPSISHPEPIVLTIVVLERVI